MSGRPIPLFNQDHPNWCCCVLEEDMGTVAERDWRPCNTCDCCTEDNLGRVLDGTST